MNYVYVMYSNSLDKYYIGETIDLDNRIKKHNSGFYGTSFTSQVKDWKLFYSIECENRNQARKIETHIKKMKSKTYIQSLKTYPEITIKLKQKYSDIPQ
ncbi:GIY-YIG nuclease family protein [Winogradskyella sp.]|uniref:GIY-YIG nuclease family protein n=1 Tax=Winogradskyella sp. TaxID=1883156 RepID=UPI002613133A|nr:GIY-YIG nuclease family protein [Winogradskyella sp.]